MFNILNNDKFEINVCETKEDDSNDNGKTKYQVVYRTNNLHDFIKWLFMISEHIIKNFSNLKTTRL